MFCRRFFGHYSAIILMSGDLTGVRAKIDRAIEHKTALGAAIDEWLSRKPYRFQEHADAETGWFTLTFRELEAPPLRLGAIFGDFVNNLESALDILISDLVRASGGKPSSGNYFPVVTILDRWDRARSDKLKGVPDAWADKIKAVQPFHDGPLAYRHPLSVLHCANKINKHTVLIPTVVSSFEWEPTFELNRNAEVSDQVAHDLGGALPPPVGSVFIDGQIWVRVRAISPRNDLRVTGIRGGVPAVLGVGFDLGIEMDGSPFPDLLAFVVGVVDEFEEVLSS